MNKVSKIIASDIIEKIPDNPKAQITRQKKADIVLDLASGVTWKEIEKTREVATCTVANINKVYKELINEIQNKLTTYGVDRKVSIMNKYLNLLDKKAERVNNSDEKLDYTKMNEISSVTKDLWTMTRTEQGEATSITEYKGKDKETLLKELKEATLVLEQGDKKALLHTVFKEND